MNGVKLKLLPTHEYIGVDPVTDPIRFYHWPVIGSLYRRRIELCLSECAGGQRVLDVGFGSGVNFLNLADRYTEIHGLDLSAEVEKIQGAFERRGIKLFLKQGNILEMPYPDEMFDTVFLVSILEHLKPEMLAQAFQEIKRVLKKDGQMVYGVPVEADWWKYFFLPFGIDLSKHHFSKEFQITRLARDYFQCRRMVSLSHPVPFLEPLYRVGHFIKS